MGFLIQDLRYGVRMLAKSPGFTAIAILMLALGIGANTVIFSVANALLIRPLPYQDPDRLVIVTNARGPNRRPFSYQRATFIQEHGQSFDGFAPFVTENFNVTGRGDPEQLPAARVAGNFFQVLGVRPALGRTFRAEEDRPGSHPAVLISDSLWKRRFGGDPAVLGQSITLDSVDTTIIGVMPLNFEFAPLGRSIDLWSTRTFEVNNITAEQVRGGITYLIAVARVRRGVSLDQAQAEMGVLDSQYRLQSPELADADPKFNISLNRVQTLMVANVRTALLVLFGAVGFVLLIACANVASLHLSRALARRKEIAVRTALGASRAGIVRQLLTESILLATAGGAIGVALSFWTTRAMPALPATALPRINPVQIDGQVLAFTVAVSLLSGVLFGLMPALQLAKSDVQAVLRDEGRGTTSGGRRNLLRSLLVVSQVALSLILLIGASLLMRSFVGLQSVNVGFNPRNLLVMNIALPPSRYSTDSRVTGFFDRLLAQVAVLPGVRSAAVSSGLPLHPARYSPLLPEGYPDVPMAQRPIFSIQGVSPTFFEAMGIPLLRGRAFTDRDREGAPLAGIVNEAFATHFWPNQSALGKRIFLGTMQQPTIVVGVAGNVKNIRLAVESVPELYYPLMQRPSHSMNLVVRGQGDPRALSAPVRSEILTIDKEQPATDVRTMEQHLADSITPNRLTTLLLVVFSSMALAVASVGLYGLISYSVAQRTHEMGIRLALGARPGDVLRLVMRQGFVLAILGIAIGLGGAYFLTTLMKSLLYEVSATDAPTYASCGILFLAVALVASYFPARRAARCDPSEALRCE
jgi:putative ABC transport system permease protein